MKGFYISLLIVFGLSLLMGCTDNHVEKNVKQLEKTEKVKEGDSINNSKYVKYSVPFKISEIKSVIVNLNDPASEISLRGVRYEVSLFSEDKISNEDRASFNFEIASDSSLNESLGPIRSLYLIDTGYGHLYTLSFETIYRDYSKEELEKLNKERNFQIYLHYKGENNEIEFL